MATLSPAAPLWGSFDSGSGTLTLSPGWHVLDALPGPAACAAWREGFPAPARLQDCARDLAHARWQPIAGHYLLVVQDADRSRLTLARDTTGSLPLYWHREATGMLHFATTLTTLRARLPRAPALSMRGLHEYLRFLDISAPATLYEDVFALRSAQALRFDRHGHTVMTAQPADIVVMSDYHSACDDIETALRHATLSCLAGSARPLAFLSGGIDSALLCALARQGGQAPETVTVGFDQAALDESAQAARIAHHLGLRHHLLRPDAKAFAQAFRRAHAQAEQPYCDPAGIATRLAFEYCATLSDRVLDGTGAEALPGVTPPRWQRLSHDHFSRWPAALRRAGGAALSRLPGLQGYARLFDAREPAEVFIRWQGFRTDEIARLTQSEVDLRGTHFHTRHAALAHASHAQRLAELQGLALPDDRFQQAALATGVAIEQPFCAPDVSARLQSVRLDWAGSPARPKRLLRDLLARHVPPELWDGPKRGFNFDLLGLMHHAERALLREHLPDASALAGLPIDPQPAQRVLDAFLAGDETLAHRVWALMNLAAWAKEHGL